MYLLICNLSSFLIKYVLHIEIPHPPAGGFGMTRNFISRRGRKKWRFDLFLTFMFKFIFESPLLPSPVIKTEMSSRIHPHDNFQKSWLILSGWMRDPLLVSMILLNTKLVFNKVLSGKTHYNPTELFSK
jgi:hypothetical protein